MPPRLVDLYPIGVRVEIALGGDHWVAGIVVAHQHPGLWVETAGDQRWFVTNRSRIRQVETGDADHGRR